MEKEQMNVVVVGHVDHGKSTLLGRLFADTESLPKGKLEQVKENCRKNSKVFEYAFLLDALKDEQSQGITIDSARTFFKTNKRDYIIIDAPGHIEFLKNMISGAARAEAALLLIDAKEGVMENSKRHAYMLSMLGIKQVVVCINKMDLVDYDKNIYEKIKSEYTKFLEEINVKPKKFIAISARDGDNVAMVSDKMNWFGGKTVLSIFDEFEKESAEEEKPLRMPVQDVYKFSNMGDSRRIVAGRIESGKVNVGDKVVFLPSNKRSEVNSIEEFNSLPKTEASAGKSIGVTLKEQIYIGRGEIMCRKDECPTKIGTSFKANIFWMGKDSLMENKIYDLKIGTKKIPVKIKEITSTLNTSNLSIDKDNRVEKNSVGECILECQDRIAFDKYSDFKSTGRFVLVDNYEISGGGIITDEINTKQTKAFRKVFLREKNWEHSFISEDERVVRLSQRPNVILITGSSKIEKKTLAKNVERVLFNSGRFVYFLGIGNILRGLDSDIDKTKREEHIRRFGEVAHILLDSGLIVIATASDLTSEELKLLQALITKDSLNIVSFDDAELSDFEFDARLYKESDIDTNAQKILKILKYKNIIFEI